MKKISLFMITGIFLVSGAFGTTEDSMAEDQKMKPVEKDISLEQIPKFQKLKFINNVKGYTPELNLNDSLPEPGPGVKEFQIQAKSPNNVLVTFPGAAWPMFSLHLVFRNKTNEIDSGEKIVPWKSARDKKAEILNIFGEKLEGVDVSIERDKDMFTVTVERKSEAEHESDKKESMTKSKSATF